LRGATRAREVGRRGRRNRDFMVKSGDGVRVGVLVDEMRGWNEKDGIYSPWALLEYVNSRLDGQRTVV